MPEGRGENGRIHFLVGHPVQRGLSKEGRFYED